MGHKNGVWTTKRGYGPPKWGIWIIKIGYGPQQIGSVLQKNANFEDFL